MHLKRQRGTNDFLCILESRLGSANVMSFGFEVIVTRFNRRKERVNTMTEISNFTKYVYVTSMNSTGDLTAFPRFRER